MRLDPFPLAGVPSTAPFASVTVAPPSVVVRPAAPAKVVPALLYWNWFAEPPGVLLPATAVQFWTAPEASTPRG